MDNIEGAPNGDRSEHGNGGGRSSDSLNERVTRVSGSAQEMWETTRESFTDLRDRMDVRGRVGRHPFGMLAAALGAGYVLGGGIFTPLTGRIVGMGLRMALRAAAIPFIKDELATLIDAARGGGDDPDEGSRGEGRRSRQQSRNENQGRQP